MQSRGNERQIWYLCIKASFSSLMCCLAVALSACASLSNRKDPAILQTLLMCELSVVLHAIIKAAQKVCNESWRTGNNHQNPLKAVSAPRKLKKLTSVINIHISKIKYA